MSLDLDVAKLLEKYKIIVIMTEDLKNMRLNASSVHDRHIKTDIRTYGDKVHTNFSDRNVPEDGIVCENFPFIFIDSDQMIDYVDDNLLLTYEN